MRQRKWGMNKSRAADMTCNQCQFTKAGNLPLKIALEKVLQPKEHHLVEFSASGFEVPVLVIRKGTSSMTVSSSQWPQKQGDHWLFPTPRNSATCLTCWGVARVNLRGVWRVLAPVRSLVRIAQQPRMTRNKYKLGSTFNSPVAEFRIVSFTLFIFISYHSQPSCWSCTGGVSSTPLAGTPWLSWSTKGPWELLRTCSKWHNVVQQRAAKGCMGWLLSLQDLRSLLGICPKQQSIHISWVQPVPTREYVGIMIPGQIETTIKISESRNWHIQRIQIIFPKNT